MDKNRKCRNCAYCSISEQYCSAHDMDLSYKFIATHTGCKEHKYTREIEEEYDDDI